MTEDLRLAALICSCNEVEKAIGDRKHPCFRVVEQQTLLIASETERQRPEPWIGTISRARLLFVSSNPSISEEPGKLREDFPTNSMEQDESAEFFINRFNPKLEKVHATFGHKVEPDFLTRSKDGEYRSGMKNPKESQKTWLKTHDRAMELLGTSAHPHEDYALTEIIHCKSKNGKGVVAKASSLCICKWMTDIFALSPARVVVVFGQKVRDQFAKPFLGAPKDFGLDKNYEDLSQLQRSMRDIIWTDFGGVSKIVLFNWHPMAYKNDSTKILKEVYGDKVVTWLASVIGGISVPPRSSEELKEVIVQLFNE